MPQPAHNSLFNTTPQETSQALQLSSLQSRTFSYETHWPLLPDGALLVKPEADKILDAPNGYRIPTVTLKELKCIETSFDLAKKQGMPTFYSSPTLLWKPAMKITHERALLERVPSNLTTALQNVPGKEHLLPAAIFCARRAYHAQLEAFQTILKTMDPTLSLLTVSVDISIRVKGVAYSDCGNAKKLLPGISSLSHTHTITPKDFRNLSGISKLYDCTLSLPLNRSTIFFPPLPSHVKHTYKGDSILSAKGLSNNSKQGLLRTIAFETSRIGRLTRQETLPGESLLIGTELVHRADSPIVSNTKLAKALARGTEQDISRVLSGIKAPAGRNNMHIPTLDRFHLALQFVIGK